jgi:hypothetical protein
VVQVLIWERWKHFICGEVVNTKTKPETTMIIIKSTSMCLLDDCKGEKTMYAKKTMNVHNNKDVQQ